MNRFKLLVIALVTVMQAAWSHAQCTKLIPANVNVISSDSIVDCSFLVTQTFLVCPGATLTVIGNSTCFNKFFVESGGTVVFNDTFPSVPYGMFSFYMKSGSTLDFNIFEFGPTPYIDTLVFENGVTMMDTGSYFMDSTLCATLVFDYSNLPGGVSPCQPNAVINASDEIHFDLFPNPATDGLTIQHNGKEQLDVVIYDLVGKELERFLLDNTLQHRTTFIQRWNGAAIIELRDNGKLVGRKLLIRNQ